MFVPLWNPRFHNRYVLIYSVCIYFEKSLSNGLGKSLSNFNVMISEVAPFHDDVIKWKHCPRYWPYVRGIIRSTVNSLHKGQWCGALVFPLICAWKNGWANNRDAGDLRRHRAHYDVSIMRFQCNLAGFFIYPMGNEPILKHMIFPTVHFC